MQNNKLQSNKQIMLDIGRRLQKQRLDLNLTQKTVAERAGISLRTISNIEDGQNYSFDTLISLLKALNLISELDNLSVIPSAEPIVMFKKPKRNKRQRASKRTTPESSWKWGDEK